MSAESKHPGAMTVYSLAAHVVERLADNGYIIVQVPTVGHRAKGESNADRYMDIAARIRQGYAAGGSISCAATAELLHRVATALAAAVSAEGER